MSCLWCVLFRRVVTPVLVLSGGRGGGGRLVLVLLGSIPVLILSGGSTPILVLAEGVEVSLPYDLTGVPSLPDRTWNSTLDSTRIGTPLTLGKDQKPSLVLCTWAVKKLIYYYTILKWRFLRWLKELGKKHLLFVENKKNSLSFFRSFDSQEEIEFSHPKKQKINVHICLLSLNIFCYSCRLILLDMS